MRRTPAFLMLICLCASVWALALPPAGDPFTPSQDPYHAARTASAMELSTSTGVPGHPMTISFAATGISEAATWTDYYGEFGSGEGVYPCGDDHPDSTEPHVIPVEWLEDGEEDCVNGTDENPGIAAAYATGSAATYKVWAESASGEIYNIASGRSPVDGEVHLTWDIPAIQPTGAYTICADQSIPADVWSMEAYDWPYDETGNRNLELYAAGATSICTRIDIEIYELSLTPVDEVVLPGGQATIEGLVTNPVNGALVDAQSLEAMAMYWTDDATNGLTYQEQNLYLPRHAEFNVSFLIPSNIYADTSSSLRQISVIFWANASGGSQVKTEALTLHVGEVDVTILEPASATSLSRETPFVFQAQAWIDGPSTTGDPVDDLDLKVTLVQGAFPTTLITSAETDAQGLVTAVISLENISVTGVAELRVEWTDAGTMGMHHTTQTVYISDGEGGGSLAGQGIHLEAMLTGDEGVPGSTLPITVRASDDGGDDLGGAWLHWRVEMDSHQGWWTAMEPTPWAAVATDASGEAVLEVDIPLDFNRNEGELYLTVIGYNASGVSDSLSLEVPMADQEVRIHPDRLAFLPGDEIVYRVESKGYSGEVTFFHQANEGTSGHVNADAADPVEIRVLVPPSWPYSIFDFEVEVASSQGLSTSTHRLMVERYWNIHLEVRSPVVNPGQQVDVSWEVDLLVSDQRIDYPLVWTASIDGDLADMSTGLIQQEEGSLSFGVPSDADPGVYVIHLQVEGTTHLLVYTVEEEQSLIVSMVTGAEPSVSYLALIASLVCLGLLLLRKDRGGKGDGLLHGHEIEDAMRAQPLANTVPPPAASAPPPVENMPPLGAGPMPPPPGSPALGPPANAVGKVDDDGFEWILHMGTMWYRRPGFGAPWQPFTG